jgi:hypothetical protein
MRAVGDDAQNLSRAMIQGAGGLTALQRGLEAYRDKFFTDGERADAASRELATTFGQLGIAMPTSNAGFRALIDSIDTSTDGGSGALRQLIALAPAFADVTDAAKDQLDQFDSLMAKMRGPGYTRGLQTMQRDDALSRFMARTAGPGHDGGPGHRAAADDFARGLQQLLGFESRADPLDSRAHELAR